MDWKWWIPTVVSVVTLVLGWWQVRLQMKQSSAVSGRRAKPRIAFWSRYWPVVFTVTFIVLAWVPYILLSEMNATDTIQYEQLVPTWGLDYRKDRSVQLACHEEIDGPRLRGFEGKFNVVVVCGVVEANVDRHTDVVITISNPFTIRDRPFHIQAPFNQMMYMKLKERAMTAVSTTEQAQPVANVWFETAVVPKNVDMANVHSMADIERVGGKIIVQPPRSQGISIRAH